MLKRIIKLIFIIIGGTIGIVLIPDLIHSITNGNMPLSMSYLIGIIILSITIYWLIDSGVSLVRKIEETLLKVPVTNVLFGSFGLILGLFVAFLVTSPLKAISIGLVNTVFPILLTLLFGYLGLVVGFKKRNDLKNLLSTSKQNKTTNKNTTMKSKKKPVRYIKILDTSVILDGRIEEVCKTGFLEGTLVIPQFVLEEVQHIADSADVIKRNRGRRSLDTLNKIQKELNIKVEIYEDDFNEIREVDRIVSLAKLLNGIIVTNNSNLSRIYNLQDVKVLNIEELAKALKPAFLPGDKINVQVVKDGKDDKQAIAYLNDGTMIVIDKGKDFMGKYIEVLVTKVLQNSAGKMIFAEPII